MSLPVGFIARAAYASVLRDPGALLRHAAMPWLVVMLASVLAGLPDGSWIAGPMHTPLTNLVIEWGPGISFTVAWVRWVVLREHRPALAAPRYGRREIVMLAFTVVLPFAVVAPIAVPLALGRLAGAGPVMNVAVTILVAAAVLWAVTLMLRTMLVLPLVALGAGAAAALRSWRATRGHALAMLGLLALTEAPPAIVQAVVPLAIDGASGPLAWLALALDAVLYFPAAAIGASAAALAARHLGAVPEP